MALTDTKYRHLVPGLSQVLRKESVETDTTLYISTGTFQGGKTPLEIITVISQFINFRCNCRQLKFLNKNCNPLFNEKNAIQKPYNPTKGQECSEARASIKNSHPDFPDCSVIVSEIGWALEQMQYRTQDKTGPPLLSALHKLSQVTTNCSQNSQ